MPELPEVHTTATFLDRALRGKIITNAWSDYHVKSVQKIGIKDSKLFSVFSNKILGKKILSVTRRAKNILFRLSDNISIVAHMKMTGHFLLGAYRRKKEWVGPIPPTFEHEEWIPTERGDLQNPFNRFIRFVISFSDGTTLALSDLRRFARIEFFDTLRLENEFKKFGPEPLEKSFTFTVYKKQILKRTTGKIKTILMDQSIIAGIGNIYSDEILYSADVHPESNPSRIPHAELKKIYTAMRLILKKSIRLGGDSMSDYRKPDGTRGEFQNCHNAYRRTGKPCKKRNCSGIITRKKVGGRSAHFCPIHQKLY